MDHLPKASFDTLAKIVASRLPISGGDGSPRDARGIAEIAPEEWPELAALAHRHSVLPLVQSAIAHLSTPPPADIAAGLHRGTIGQTMRSLALQSEAVRLTRCLDEAEIPFMILKGLALQDAYGSLALRPFVDNDVLVHPSDFERAERLLVGEVGYVRERRSRWQKRGYLFVHGQYTFGRFVSGSPYTLDVHTSVMPFGYRYSEEVHSLLGRSRHMELEGLSVPVLSWADQLIVLCVNGLKDRWNRLRLVADLVAVASKIDDWAVVAQIARRASSLSPVLLGMVLADDLLGRPLPPELGVPTPALLKLAHEMSHRLASEESTQAMKEWERVRLFLLAQDNVAAQMRYVAYTLIRRATNLFLRGSGEATADL